MFRQRGINETSADKTRSFRPTPKAERDAREITHSGEPGRVIFLRREWKKMAEEKIFWKKENKWAGFGEGAVVYFMKAAKREERSGMKKRTKKKKEINHDTRNRTVRRKMGAYFEQCDQEGKKYTYPGLQVALGVSREVMEEWSRDRKLGRDLELARAKIRDGLEQREDQMALFLRRQDREPTEELAGTKVFFEREGDVGEYGK